MAWLRTSQSYSQSVRMAQAYQNDAGYNAMCESFSSLVGRICQFVCCHWNSCFSGNPNEVNERTPLRARVDVPPLASALPLPIPPARNH